MIEKNEKQSNEKGYVIIEPSNNGNLDCILTDDVVVGLDEQKKTLHELITWFKNVQEYTKRGVKVPKGCILFGDPGNGKSLLIKEVIKYSGLPTLFFKGDNNECAPSLYKAFDEFKNEKQGLIVIDELDLLIDRDNGVTRALQECIDGVLSNNNVFVLCATNRLSEIPHALLRDGRLGIDIFISNPKYNDCSRIFRRSLNRFGVGLSKECDDDEEIGILLNGSSAASLSALANDLVLRNGFVSITMEMLEKSIYNILGKEFTNKKKISYRVCLHEAAHALMAHKYSNYFNILRVFIGDEGGMVEFDNKEDITEETYGMVIANIEIAYAGSMAEKVILGEGSTGGENDLDSARRYAYNLFNRSGYGKFSEVLPIAGNPHSRTETFIKRRHNERKIECLLRKCERTARKFIKKNVENIKKIADVLEKKRIIRLSEIRNIIGEIN